MGFPLNPIYKILWKLNWETYTNRKEWGRLNSAVDSLLHFSNRDWFSK